MPINSRKYIAGTDEVIKRAIGTEEESHQAVYFVELCQEYVGDW